MKRRLTAGAFAVAFALSTFAGTALAATPANPGCFGTARSGWITATAGNGQLWGEEASDRAGTNAANNLAWMIANCVGNPVPTP